MIAKTDKPLTAKQTSFVQFYADAGSETYNNIMQSMIKAGYKPNYAKHWNNKILDNNGISKANFAYRAKIGEKLDRSREYQHTRLDKAYEIALDKDNPAAMVSVVKEQNAMLGYHTELAPNSEKEASRLALLDSERDLLLAFADAQMQKRCRAIESEVINDV